MSKPKISIPSREYDPGKLFSVLMELKGFTTASELAELLDVNPSTIRNIKTRRLALSLKLLMRIQKVSGMSICEMRDLMDDRRMEIRIAESVDSE